MKQGNFFYLLLFFLAVIQQSNLAAQVNSSRDSYVYANSVGDNRSSERENGKAVVMGTKQTERMRIASNGYVGIGTSSPTRKLHVKDGVLRMERSSIIVDINVSSNEAAGWIGTYTNHPLEIATNNSAKMYISTAGNVGIGTVNPLHKLHVEGKSYFKDNVGIGITSPNKGILHVKGSVHVENSNSEQVFHISAGKQLVFVGKDAYDQYTATKNNASSVIQENDYSLWVSKGVVSEDFALADVEEWDDYVFAEDYQLPTLQEVEAFVKTNSHLPAIPSAAEVKAHGYSLHQMDRGLLKTVEELTLYTIEQEKKITDLEQQNQAMAEELAQIKVLLESVLKK